MFRFCLADAVLRESAVLSQKATRYKTIPASGGIPRMAGTFCPPGGKHYLRTLDPAERNAVEFFSETDFIEMRCVGFDFIAIRPYSLLSFRRLSANRPCFVCIYLHRCLMQFRPCFHIQLSAQ